MWTPPSDPKRAIPRDPGRWRSQACRDSWRLGRERQKEGKDGTKFPIGFSPASWPNFVLTSPRTLDSWEIKLLSCWEKGPLTYALAPQSVFLNVLDLKMTCWRLQIGFVGVLYLLQVYTNIYHLKVKPITLKILILKVILTQSQKQCQGFFFFFRKSLSNAK